MRPGVGGGVTAVAQRRGGGWEIDTCARTHVWSKLTTFLFCPETPQVPAVSKVSRVEQGFANRRSLEFLKDKARLKERCGQVTAAALADVECLLRQLCGFLGINGQGMVSNLKRVLMHQGLYSSGPKPGLVQRVHNYMNLIRGSPDMSSLTSASD